MSITGRGDLLRKVAGGQGYYAQFEITSTFGGSSPGNALTSGLFAFVPFYDSFASLEPFPLPPGSDPLRLLMAMISTQNTSSISAWLARWYVIGTVDLSATGDRLVHDSATFPLLRKELGQVSQPIDLLPVIRVTTGLTGSATIRLRTVAGGAGYVDPDGNNVVGTLNFVVPTGAVLNSLYMLRPEYGDSGVRDVAAVEVTAAATAGVIEVLGVELLAPVHHHGTSGYADYTDILFGAASFQDLRPAVATSGTVTSKMIGMSCPSRLISQPQSIVSLMAVRDP